MNDYDDMISDSSLIYSQEFFSDDDQASSVNEDFFHAMSTQGRLMMPQRKVFVYGENLKPQITYINEADFTSAIHEHLYKNKYHSVFSIQSVSWNQIASNRSVAIVNGPNSGKTMAYLPSLLSILSKQSQSEEEETSQGPVAVIIAQNSSVCEEIFKLSFKLAPKIKTVSAYGKWNFKKKLIDLLNGCHLLITTPPCFKRFSETEALKLFDKQKIKHLVLENLNLMLEKFKGDIANVLKICTFGAECAERNPQIIITTTCWQEYLHKYMALAHEPVFVIGSFIEAALFAKSRFIVMRKSYEEKKAMLLDYLWRYEWRMKKTAIVFSNEKEMDDFKIMLSNSAIGYRVLDKTTRPIDLGTWINEKHRNMTLLLVLDDIGTEMSLGCVQILINYSLPDTWTKFSRRFTLSLNHYKVYCDMSEKTNEAEPLVMILMDDTKIIEIPRIINFLIDRRLVQSIPPDVYREVQQIKYNQEGAKIDAENKSVVPLCTQLLKYASCSATKCPKRHAFIPGDQPKFIPNSGAIKFIIKGMHSPLHYVIEITDHLPLNSHSWISFERKNERIRKNLQKFQNYMQDEKNLMMDGYLKLENFYGFYDQKEMLWKRCKITKVLESNEYDIPVLLQIEFVDCGGSERVKSLELMKLPNQLQEMNPLVCHLRVVNLCPYDQDEVFDYQTISSVKSYMEMVDGKAAYARCNVELAAGRTIVTTNIQIYQKLTNLRHEIMNLSLKRFLLENEYVVENDSVLDSLKKIAALSSFEIPEQHKTENEAKQLNENVFQTWENLNLTTGNVYQAKLLRFEGPHKFYIQIIHKDQKEVEERLKDIENCQCQTQLTKVTLGTVCLYRSKDGKTKRCKVIKEDPLNLFLVDHGEEIEIVQSAPVLYTIPPEMCAIPLQAIECGLKGLKPKAGFLLRQKLMFIILFREVSNDNVFEIKVHSKIGNKYLVTVHNREKGINLNDQAIKKGIAKLEEAENIKQQLQGVEKTDGENHLQIFCDPDNYMNSDDLFCTMFGLPNTARIVPMIEDEKESETEILQLKPEANLTMIESKCKRSEQLPTLCENKAKVLKSIYPRPVTKWSQNDKIVKVKVEALDLLKYSLMLTEIKAEICIECKDRVSQLLIYLYGSVLPEFVSHKSNGLEVTIFMVKKYQNVTWARLTMAKQVQDAIKYSPEELFIDSTAEDRETVIEKINFMPAGYEIQENDYDEFEDPLEDEYVI